MINTKNIEQHVVFEGVSPHEVYEILMDQKKFEAMCGKRAEISRAVGGTVTAYEGFVRAINVELIPDTKIVQAWKGGIPEWPKDYFSIVVFELEQIENGTRLSFTQIGVPEAGYSIIDAGWPQAYWEPMKKVFTG